MTDAPADDANEPALPPGEWPGIHGEPRTRLADANEPALLLGEWRQPASGTAGAARGR